MTTHQNCATSRPPDAAVDLLRLELHALVDDLDSDLADEAVADSPDHQLYAWTGWLLEWTVTALSTPE